MAQSNQPEIYFCLLNANMQKNISWILRQHICQSAQASCSTRDIRNTMCLPVVTSVIMCNHFCANSKKWWGSVTCKTAWLHSHVKLSALFSSTALQRGTAHETHCVCRLCYNYSWPDVDVNKRVRSELFVLKLVCCLLVVWRTTAPGLTWSF